MPPKTPKDDAPISQMFQPGNLATIGNGRVLAQFDAALQRVAQGFTDPTQPRGKATITLTLDLNVSDTGAVAVKAKSEIKMPKAKPTEHAMSFSERHGHFIVQAVELDEQPELPGANIARFRPKAEG